MDRAKVYIETYGCASSQNDSEIMAGLLSEKFEIVNDIEQANVVIINTCTVKRTTENKLRFRIKEVSEKYPEKKLVIAGCMPEAQPNLVKELAPDASLLSTNRIKEIVSVVEKTLKNEKCELLGKVKHEKTNLPKIRKNPVVDIIEICSGCDYACTYCITKLAKGSTFSYSSETILRQMRCSLASGVKEFWITGQDISAYNYNGMKLPDLLEFIEKHLHGKYFIRLGMMHPSNVKSMLRELIGAYKSDHIFKFLHLPVQSGSNTILEKMKRDYTVSEFKKIVSSFRKSIPEITVWTDVIVGFPEETEEDFKKTLKLIEDIKPDFVNVSRYSVRPGTVAARMKQLPTEILKERSRKASEIVNKISLEKNQEWIGWEGEVLIDEFNENKRTWIGRNFAYKPVVLDSKLKLGDIVKVKIVSAERTHLLGEVI